MIRRIAVGLGGAAIGSVLGWTIAIFTGWTPVIAVVAIVFGLLAAFSDWRDTSSAPDEGHQPTRLFPPDR